MLRLTSFAQSLGRRPACAARRALGRGLRCGATAAALWLAGASAASAQMEFHYQYGRLTNPFTGQQSPTSILTIQQAMSWSYGDSFFFIDFLDDELSDGFNEKDLYGEWYPTLSFSKLAGRTVGGGPVRDIALIGGINFDADANFMKYLPGVRVAWDVPGFLFLNTDITAFLDANDGVRPGDAPRTSDSFMFDINWGAVFDVGNQSFLFTGHAEYIGATTIKPTGGEVKSWVLAQPQLTWDLSKALNGTGNELFVGVEYQYWGNKLGADGSDNVAQFLVIWRL